MRNLQLYQKLKQKALDGGYTIEQVRDVSFDQCEDLLGQKLSSYAFFENMKECLIVELQERDDELNLQQVKQKVKTWFDANFPEWEITKRRVGDKPCIMIWLKGKPVING